MIIKISNRFQIKKKHKLFFQKENNKKTTNLIVFQFLRIAIFLYLHIYKWVDHVTVMFNHYLTSHLTGIRWSFVTIIILWCNADIFYKPLNQQVGLKYTLLYFKPPWNEYKMIPVLFDRYFNVHVIYLNQHKYVFIIIIYHQSLLKHIGSICCFVRNKHSFLFKMWIII